MWGTTRKEQDKQLEGAVTLAAQRAWALALEKEWSVAERVGAFKTELLRIRSNNDLMARKTSKFEPVDADVLYSYAMRVTWEDISLPNFRWRNQFSPKEIEMLKRVYDYVTPTTEEAALHLALERAKKDIIHLKEVTQKITNITDHREKKDGTNG